MNERNHSERDREHPLFRALVLMGGGLALSCGGSAVIDGNAAGSGGSRAVGGAPQGGTSFGGTSFGGTSVGGTSVGGMSAVDGGTPDCPPSQWDCTALGLTPCSYYWLGETRPEGCVCDPKRPKSVADCQPNEALYCLAASTDPAATDTFDGTHHVQCTCVPVQTTPLALSECQPQCAKTYPALNHGGVYTVYCSQPPSQTCDDSFGNNCTATPASVLRQDGVVCGCASIVLK